MKLQSTVSITCTVFKFLFFCSFFNNAGAQVSYTYDANGNRLASSIVVNHRPKKIRSDDTTKRDSAAEQTANRLGISVYPNPTKNSVTVNATNLNNTDAAIVYLMDVSGNTIFTKTTNIFPLPIDMTSYAAGVYFVKVLIDKQQLYYRVIKEK